MDGDLRLDDSAGGGRFTLILGGARSADTPGVYTAGS
jgi:hypothetical protein